MDPKRFDNWTRSRAARFSRRDALKVVGVGGVAALLPEVAAAQQSCSLTLHAEISGGPSAPIAYDAVLQFTLDGAGDFTAATFTPQGEAAVSATGHATGRAIDVHIELGSGQVLSFSGAGAQPISTCPEVVGGIFSGPQPGDVGAWQVTLASGATASASTTSQGSTAICPSGQVQCAGNCVPACPAGQSLDQSTCTCVAGCTPDQGSCSSSTDCCSGFCDNSSGTCQTCQFLACEGVGCVDPSFDPNNCGACGVVCSAPTATCTDGACACQVDGLPCVKHYDCCSDSCNAGICGCVTVGNDCSSFETICCGRDEGATTVSVARVAISTPKMIALRITNASPASVPMAPASAASTQARAPAPATPNVATTTDSDVSTEHARSDRHPLCRTRQNGDVT